MQQTSPHPELGWIDCTLAGGTVRVWPIGVVAMMQRLATPQDIVEAYTRCLVFPAPTRMEEDDHTDLFSAWTALTASEPQDDEQSDDPTMVEHRQEKRLANLRDAAVELMACGLPYRAMFVDRQPGAPYDGWTVYQFRGWLTACSRHKSRAHADRIEAMGHGSSAVAGGRQGAQKVNELIRRLRHG